jgi:formamidopyrimidine-DNA glycosylase
MLLGQRLGGRISPIKPLLLDQGFIAGIGNMYADEILFRARIHPLRKADSLTKRELKVMYQAIRDVLSAAIDNSGASIDTYVRPGGEYGTAHYEFSVAHRLGQPCPVCGTPIQRIMIRQRGTYYCPRCQKM